MITEQEYIGNNKNISEVTMKNIKESLRKWNIVRVLYDRPMKVTSGYRSVAYNKKIGGAKNSNHCKGLAIDILDIDGRFYKWCIQNEEKLREIKIWIEEKQGPWVHMQTVAYGSYNETKSIFFKP